MAARFFPSAVLGGLRPIPRSSRGCPGAGGAKLEPLVTGSSHIPPRTVRFGLRVVGKVWPGAAMGLRLCRNPGRSSGSAGSARAGRCLRHPGRAVVPSARCRPHRNHGTAASREGLAPEATHKALSVTPGHGRAITPPEPSRQCSYPRNSCRFPQFPASDVPLGQLSGRHLARAHSTRLATKLGASWSRAKGSVWDPSPETLQEEPACHFQNALTSTDGLKLPQK